MKKKIFLSVFISVFSSVYSQENLFSFQNSLKKTTLKINKIFNVIDNSSNNISLSLVDAGNIYSYLFNDNFKKIGQIRSKNLPNWFKELLGSSVNKNIHSYYFSNYKNSKFGVYTLDFKKGIAITKKIDLNFEKEYYIESFTTNNTFYILTVKNDSSILNIYKFKSGSFEKKELDFSKHQFINKKNKKTSLYNILKPSNPSKILNESTSSILKSFNKVKIYIDNKNLQISIDDSFYVTQIITIDLELFTFNYEKINTPFIDAGSSVFKKSNSFLCKGLLFQISSSTKTAKFRIIDLYSKKILKEYFFSIGKAITFDSELIETKKSKRKAKSFLSRMTTHNMGASVNFSKNSYNIEIGSYILARNSSGITPNRESSSGVNLFNFYGGNNIYSKTINDNFDKNFNLIKINLTKNKISPNEYFLKNKKKIETKTIFKYKGNLILGFLIKNSKGVKFLKFLD